MPIKITMRYSFTPIKMAILQKHRAQLLVRMWRNRNPCALPGRKENSTATVEDSTPVPQILKQSYHVVPQFHS